MAQHETTNDIVRIALLVLAIVILGPMILMVVLFPLMGMWGGGHMWGDGMVGYGTMPVWWGLMPLLWLVILLAIGFVLYRWSAQRHPGAGDPAIEELRMAYARGDLSQEEFEDRRESLRGGQHD